MKLQVLIRGSELACLSACAMGFAPQFTEQPQRSSNKNSITSSCGTSRIPSTTTAIHSSPSFIETASIDISESAPRDIASMEQWATQYGIQRADSFQLAQDTTGQDVYATTNQDLPAETPVLYVPASLILSSNKATAELKGPQMFEAENSLVSNGAETEMRHWYLMLKVLKEVQDGRSSPWFHWLNSLPRHYSNAVAMTDFCLSCLPPLMKKLTSEEKENQHRLSLQSIQSVPFLEEHIRNDPDLCRWAYQVVYTRAVETDDGDLRIVPMADYFNHGSQDWPEIASSYDDAGNYYAYSQIDVPAGSPLRFQYSDPRNPSHLMARYGFLDEECPATYCKLLPPAINQDMIDLGYSHDRMLFYRNGEVADEVWDIFLYQHLSATDLDDQQSLMRAHRTGDYDTKLALHNKHYGATSAALLEHVDGFIEEIDRVIRKAETIGVSDPNSIYIKYEHPRLPLIHRHNLFVKETFQSVRDKYSSSGGEEEGGVNWREATRVTVEECDEMECAIAECALDLFGNWLCEGGLGNHPDGSERPKTQRVVASQ
eukprot:CAMPEP_0183715368 /NCGR_PEP_ID=MMETSP0737-20130205/9618_1 /TAXON_ID=385413 /ORGANISM="Thalassiosira miniscula, Strain CCMP1093" /LENGTH=542 /DNA_ID=CAMNT_0025944459 /DNA_START=82 /DNA_END=1710 /DNA_ORIENTATION=+